MPASHQFNRRIAAFGAALALVALPVSSTVTPAFAQPSPSPSAEAGSTGTADTEANADSESAEADGSDDNEGGDDEPDPNYDKACAPPKKGDPTPGEDGPCKPARTLKARWDPNTKQLSVTAPRNRPRSLPESWKNVTFKGPQQSMVRIPAQDSTADGNAGSAGSDSDTDDSGQSVADATAQADVPTSFKFGDDGVIRAADSSEPMKFENFDSDPKWKFTADGKNITAKGKEYTDSDDGASGGSTSRANQDGDKTAGNADPDDDSQNDDGASSASASGDDDATDSGESDVNGSSGDEDGASSNSSASSKSNSSSNSSSSSDSNSASNSGSKDRANSAKNDDADGKSSNSDSGARSDDSRNSDSDSSGSGSGSSSKDEDGNDSDDPDGSPVGTADGDNTTPDPSNGNGSKDDDRETIPGTAGDEWLPGDEDNSERPDYSDPVPQNPDAPTPKDDTDLITGGDKPSPRANQQPSSSFGESIASTIVSSWPVFVLAASGMAAVGFIIYIMGRRGKQD